MIGSLLLLTVMPVAAALEYPTRISLRAGVFHAPPFAKVEKDEYGAVSYSGFQVEMLERLQVFAAQDNVTLEFQLDQTPSFYADSLDLVANDCLEVNDNKTEDCNSLDLIVGDYYCNPERSMRVDFTPAWSRTTMSTVKYIDKTSQDFTTLTQAEQAKATICVPDGTYLMEVVMEKFPGAEYYKCPSAEDCYAALKAEECVLFVDDELLLRYRAALDPSLEVTRESFNTQYLVWPMRYDLPPMVSQLMKKWIYAAIANATLDELYFSYFQKRLCPIGTAGENCELPCDPNHGTSDHMGVCVCESTRWTGADCSIEIPEDTNNIPTSLRLIAFGMLGINAVVIAACACWLYVYRESAAVRVTQPFFLLLVLLGCLISSCTIIALAQEDPGDGPVRSCMAIPWLYSVGFSVTFGTLFAKILRVYLIFTQSGQQAASGDISSCRRNSVTFKETLYVIGAVLLIDVAILIAWTVIDPLEWQRWVVRADKFGAPLESAGYCTSSSWQIFGSVIGTFHLCLLGIACYLCYMARDIPTKFSEGKYVSIAMVSNLQIFVVGVPILIILGSDPQAAFFTRSVIIWMNDLAVVSLIFGNLVYSVHFAPESASKQGQDVLKAEIDKAVSIYTANANAKAKQASTTMNSLTFNPASKVSKAALDASGSDSQLEIDFEAAAVPESYPLKPSNRRSMISSLSIGSAESYYPSSGLSSSSRRTRKISWGVACSYSETGEKDNSEVVSLAEWSDSSKDKEDRSKKAAESGEKRFKSEPIQGAPLKPPGRWRSASTDSEESIHFQSESSQSESESDTEESLDSLPSPEQSDGRAIPPVCRPHSHPIQGPPKPPARLQSSFESLDCDLSDMCSHYSEKQEKLEGGSSASCGTQEIQEAPKRPPKRRSLRFNTLEIDDDSAKPPKPPRTQHTSRPDQQRSVPPSHDPAKPPKLPCTLYNSPPETHGTGIPLASTEKPSSAPLRPHRHSPHNLFQILTAASPPRLAAIQEEVSGTSLVSAQGTSRTSLMSNTTEEPSSGTLNIPKDLVWPVREGLSTPATTLQEDVV